MAQGQELETKTELNRFGFHSKGQHLRFELLVMVPCYAYKEEDKRRVAAVGVVVDDNVTGSLEALDRKETSYHIVADDNDRAEHV